MVREVNENELSKVLELYLHLHEETIPEMTDHLKETWNTIMQDKSLLRPSPAPPVRLSWGLLFINTQTLLA